MFESIVIRNQNHGPAKEPLNLGFLAEAMLFYGNVTVISEASILRQLTSHLGPEVLIELLQEGFMELRYLENGMGIYTSDAGSLNEKHDVILFSSPKMELQHQVPTVMEEITGKKGRGRRLAKRLMELVTADTFDSTVTEQSRDDLSDAEYVKAGAREILLSYAPEYDLPDPFEFRVSHESGGLKIATTVNFEEANEIYHSRIPASHSTLTPSYILSFLADPSQSLPRSLGK